MERGECELRPEISQIEEVASQFLQRLRELIM
jgi:hypothetical protein